VAGKVIGPNLGKWVPGRGHEGERGIGVGFGRKRPNRGLLVTEKRESKGRNVIEKPPFARKVAPLVSENRLS